MADYWSDKTVFAHAGKFELASVTYEVIADFTRALPRAFKLVVTLRGLGVDLGSTTVDPIADGPISLAIVQPVGGHVDGQISDFGALDDAGNPLPPTDATWDTAGSFSFLVTALGNATLAVAAIVGLVPALGWAAKAAIGLVGKTISVNIGHKAIALPIHRDANGSPVQPQ